MAQVSRPAVGNGRAVSDAEYEALVAGYSEDGMTDGTPSSDPPVYGDGSGLAVKVRPNRWAVLRGYQWYTDASGDSVMVPANTGAARTDLAVLRLDRSDWSVRAAIVQGTPGAGAPSPTRETGDTGVYEIPLAEVDVASNASFIAASDVHSRAWYLSRNGTILCTSATRPPAAPARRIFETDRVAAYVATSYADSSWQVTLENTGWVDVPFALGNWKAASNASPIICRVNGIVYLRLGDPTKRGGLAENDDSHIINIPAGFRAAHFHRAVAQVAGGSGAVSIYPDSGTRASQVWLVNHPRISDGQQIWCGDISYPV